MGTWKRVKLTTIFTLSFVVAMFAYNIDHINKNNSKQVIEIHETHSISSSPDLKKEIEEIKIKNKKSLDKAIQLKNKENSIYVRFTSKNRRLDKKLAQEFLKAAKAFELDVYDRDLSMFISQLLYESNGYQYYPKDHKSKSNQLVVGTSGEIGIGQIMPRTAHFLMKRHMPIDVRKKMLLAGADNFDHLSNQKDYTDKTKTQMIKWLSNRENNLAMWSYVVTYYTKANQGNLTRGLVAYNRGQGGLNKYVRNGGIPSQYIYYKAIKKIHKEISI